ncbi:MAG: PAS domain S-box protein [Desulfotalea sp.]
MLNLFPRSLRILIIIILCIGLPTTIYFGHSLKQDARQRWFNQATWETEKATDTCFAWFTLQQTQLRGIATLFYGSKHVTANEFAEIIDIPKVQGSLPFHTVAYGVKDDSTADLIVTHSSNNSGIFSLNSNLADTAPINSAMQKAFDFPGEIVMSLPYKNSEGHSFFSFLMVIKNNQQSGVLIAVIDIEELLEDLAILHIPHGIYLQNINIINMADGSLANISFYTSTSSNTIGMDNVFIRADSGKLHLNFSWIISPDFLNGPQTALGTLVQVGGCVLDLILLSALILLLRENSRVTAKVKKRTTELSRAIDSTNLEIAKKARVEKALKRSSTRMKALSDASFEAIFLSQNGVCQDTNNTAVEMFGFSRDEMSGSNISNLFMPEEQEKLSANIRNDNDTPYESMARRKDGSAFPVLVKGRIITYSGKKIRVSAITDISLRRQAELARIESEQNYQKLLETTHTGVITVNECGDVLQLNKEYAKILGYQNVEELLDRNILEWTAEHDQENTINRIKECYKTGNFSQLLVDYVNNNKQIISVEINASVIVLQNQQVIMALVRDISHQRRLEEERLKVNKLESVGVLAGGIAHDFNNILVAILGNMSLAKLYVKETDKVYTLLNAAEKASYRAKDLTQQLLTFSKGGDPVQKLTSLKQLIQDSADFILRGSNVACNYVFCDDLWLVHIDSGQISQVVQNIIINSVQAIQTHGQITITCKNITPDSFELPSSLDRKHYVQVAIEDNGPGIPAAELPNIFDPYFTTKQEGTGLGLALSHSIITKHNGYITVASLPQQGACFVFYLPAAPDQQQQPELTSTPIFAGKATVLVMDDDKVIQDITLIMLQHLGYEVVLASNGEEALAIFQKRLHSDHPIDITIMDLTIPGGMGGKECAKLFLELEPKSKIIVASGYSNDPIMSNHQNHGFVGAIAKPFNLSELSAVLHSS